MKDCRIQSSAIRCVQTFLIVIAASIACLGQTGWEWENRIPRNNNLNAVTYGNGNFVAVGDTGIILKSQNGTDWTVVNKALKWKYDSSTTTNLNDVIFAKNRFVAVGGRIVTSSNADNWVIADSLIDEFSRPISLNAIACNDSLIVAVGSGGLIMVSTDGISWTKIADCDTSLHNKYDNPSLSAITYGNGQFVAVGADGSNAIITMTSPNGRDWTVLNSPSRVVAKSIAFGNGIYVAGGSRDAGMVATSSNGSSWTVNQTPPNGIYYVSSVNYTNNRFIIVGPGSIETAYFPVFSSSDGISWTADTNGTFNDLKDVSFGNGRYIAVGGRGMIETSVDGKSWVPVPAKKDNDINLGSISAGNGIYLARQNDTILLSSHDGKTWSEQNLGDKFLIDGPVFGNNLFVALADTQSGNNSTNDFKPVVLTSPDAVSWSQHQLTDVPNLNSMDYDGSRIAFGNGKFIVFSCSLSDTPGQNGVVKDYSNYYSYDGKNWVKGDYRLHTIGSRFLPLRLLYCNNLFFALGESGMIITSPDGISWSDHSVHIPGYLESAAYGNGVYVIGGWNKTFLLSHDGSTWETVAAGDQNDDAITSIAYGNNRFIAVSRNMYYSTDGKNWTEHKLNCSTYLNSICYFDDKFTVAGGPGLIIGSSDGDHWTLYHLFDKNEQATSEIRSQNSKGNSQHKETFDNRAPLIKISDHSIFVRFPRSCSDGKYSVCLFDVLGRQVFSDVKSAPGNSGMFTVPAVLSGTYLLTIQEGGNVRLSTRIVVAR